MAITQYFRDSLASCSNSLLPVSDLEYIIQGKNKVTSSELASIYPVQRHRPIKHFMLKEA